MSAVIGSREYADLLQRQYEQQQAEKEYRKTVGYEPHETSFETCEFLQAQPKLMDLFAQLPESVQTLLNEVCASRLLRPGAVDGMMQDFGIAVIRAKDSEDIYTALIHLENCVAVARFIKRGYPGLDNGDEVALMNDISRVIKGLSYRRLTKDRVPVRGRLSKESVAVASATTYLSLVFPRDKFGITKTTSFKDAEGEQLFGRFITSHALAEVIRERPEDVALICDYIKERGMGNTKKSAESLKAFLNEKVPSPLASGWV